MTIDPSLPRSAPRRLLRRQPQLRLRAPSGRLRKVRRAPSRRAWPVAMVRPRPVPPVLEPVRKRWGPEVWRTASRSAGKPGPWSRTRTTGPSTSTSTGGAPCRRALAARLARTRSTRRGSVATTASATTFTRTPSSPATARRVIALTSRSSVSTAAIWESSRATSSTSSTSPRSFRTLPATSSDARPGGNRPTAADMPATGVRSSCAISAVTRRSASRRAPSASAMVLTEAASRAISSWPWGRTRASRSPSAMRSAVRAAAVARRPIRTPSNSPARDTRTVTATPVANSVRSSAARDLSSGAYERRIASTFRSETRVAAHSTGSSPPSRR